MLILPCHTGWLFFSILSLATCHELVGHGHQVDCCCAPLPSFCIMLFVSCHTGWFLCHATTRFTAQWLELLSHCQCFHVTCGCQATGWLFSFSWHLFFPPYNFHGTQQQRLTLQHYTASLPLWPPQICIALHSFSPFHIDAMMPLMLLHCLHNAIMPHRFFA